MILTTISLLLILIAGAANGTMDTLEFHYDKSIFTQNQGSKWFNFLNHSESWKNKYVFSYNSLTVVRRKWFNLIPIPVFLTDGFHLMKFILLNLGFLGIVLYCFQNNCLSIRGLIITFLLLRSVFGLGFILMYNFILVKKR